jgi:drug/metabolite transporter (DMT)-like permease
VWAMAGDSLLIGVALAAAAATCYDGALALQATQARDTHEDEGLRIKLLLTLLREPRWVLAGFLGIAGWPLEIAAFAFAPLTVVQPTMSLGLVVLMILGSRLLHERVGPREIGATIAIGVGVGAIAAVAPHHHDEHVTLWKLAVVGGALLAIAAAPYVTRGRHPLLLAGSAGSAYALSAVMTKLITDDLGRGRWGFVAVWVALTVAIVAIGMLSEMTALQRDAATRVGPVIFVVQAVLPVLAAPFLVHETWSHPLVTLAALVVVAVGAAVLSAAPPVADLVGAGHGDGSPA